MARVTFRSIDEYIAMQPEDVQAELAHVRTAISKALPDAEEAISYQIPTYRLHGRSVVYFAAWKAHFSLYPAGDRLVAAFKDELALYEISKGTIRFPLSRPIPVRLIARIARFLAAEPAERARARMLRSAKGGGRGKTGMRRRQA